MEFVSMRDFRTQTTQIWNRLHNNEEIVITSNGRPRAFLINIPDGAFEQMLDGIRQAKANILSNDDRKVGAVYYEKEREQFNREHPPEEKAAAMREIRDMLSDIDLKK
jgi:antitoxin (DNA-binding transcriptional repressor) of toxin-antitoxin stability system